MQWPDHLPKAGFIRLPTVLSLIPVSKSTVWAWVQTGRFPAPVRSGRITMWSVESVQRFIAQLEGENDNDSQ